MSPTDHPSPLDRLFRPRSVAILGASDDPNRISGRPLRYIKEGGFKGGLYPINPNRTEVQGLKSYARLADLPEVPDVALLALPASATEQAVVDCVAAGVGAAVIFSAGYAEADEAGRALQDSIRAIAAAGGLRLLGPNCLGLFNASLGFFGTFTQSLDRGVPPPGPIAIVSQSGAYGSHLALLARRRGLGVDYWITTGNESDIDVSECLEWLALQPEVKVVMAYVEGVRDGERFIRALETARLARKPVVLMKVGRSEVGARAASSHTAALAGSDAIYDTICRQYGVHRAETTEEQIDIAYACARGLFPVGDRLGIVTLSGGVGVQMSDAAARHGLDVAPMPLAAQKRLKDLLPYAAVENPVDTTAQALNDMGLLEENLRVMLAEGGYDALIGFFTSVPATRTLSEPLRNAIRAGTSAFPDRLIVLSMVADAEIVRTYEDDGFLVFEDVDRGIAAIAALHRFAEAFARPAPLPRTIASGTASAGLGTASAGLGTRSFSEIAAKRLLASAGVPILDEAIAVDAAGAVDAARRLGFPVVMKIVSPEIEHKTEIGGVLLGLADEAAVADGFALLMARAAEHRPDATIEGVLVAPMAGAGVETIIGVAQDPVFGPAVMFGLGGVFVEVFEDVTFRLAPFDASEARRMIGEVRGRALLAGARGAAEADVEALVAALVAVSAFAHTHRDTLQTLDINPFLVRPKGLGAVALDALIVPRGTTMTH